MYDYGPNPEYVDVDDDNKAEAQKEEINKWYRETYPDIYPNPED